MRVSVQPKRLPFFKVGKELKERVNDGRLKTAAPKLPNLIDGAPVSAPVSPVSSTGPIADSGATDTTEQAAGTASRASA